MTTQKFVEELVASATQALNALNVSSNSTFDSKYKATVIEMFKTALSPVLNTLIDAIKESIEVHKAGSY